MQHTSGANLFSLNDWMTGNGGNWQEWWVVDGDEYFNEVSFGPTCPLQTVTGIEKQSMTNPQIYPTICSEFLNVRNRADELGSSWNLVNPQGTIVNSGVIGSTHSRIEINGLASGIYFFRMNNSSTKIIIQ
jgi:hypothetical protein